MDPSNPERHWVWVRNSGRDLRISDAQLRSLEPKTCKVSFNVRTLTNIREDNAFGFAIRAAISVFMTSGSEVWNQKRVKFLSMCEPETIRERIMCLGSRERRPGSIER